MANRIAALALFIPLYFSSSCATPARPEQGDAAGRPNFVVILWDDMGYGDLSLHGHPTINTPHIEAMAREGIRLTSFYAAPNCTPARAMLLTGRYSLRTGLLSPTGPGHPSGMPASEITLAEALKAQGYRTAMYGKWHLGDFESEPAFNPTAHGFDVFLGIPYSHDYDPDGVPLFRGTEMVERPVAYQTMTQRFTEEAIEFIRESAGEPFFVYLAHPMPHVPIGTSGRFVGHSRAGRYGDVIEELDGSVGEILGILEELGLDERTIVVAMSDNGPWATVGERVYDRGERGTKEVGDVGWSAILRGAKQSTQEGGVRVPAIVRWPERIPPARASADVVSIMDLFPTFVNLAGGTVPDDRPIDGRDIMPLLAGTSPSPRDTFVFIRGETVEGIRAGPWKLRIVPPARQPGGGRGQPPPRVATETTAPGQAELFHLDIDPAEHFDVAPQHPELVQRLRARLEAFRNEVGEGHPDP